MDKNQYLQQLRNATPVTLQQVLFQKERRAKRQTELLKNGGCLICFTINAVGPVKRSSVFSRAFYFGVDCVKQQLCQHELLTIIEEQYNGPAGQELFLLVEGSPLFIKRLMIEIEETIPMGRLYDIDVLDCEGKKISRQQLGFPARRCLLCEQAAVVCARAGSHTVEQLQQKTVELVCQVFNQRYADETAALCTRALLYEVAVTPKPGLVDRVNSGAHKDMDIFTFTDSASVLAPFFREFVRLGMAGSHLSPPQLFTTLRYHGRRAEEAMYRVTHGANTHKGLIFSMGVLCAAAGYLYQNEKPATVENLLSLSRQMCVDLLNDFKNIPKKEQHTAGERLYQHSRVLGVRGEAALGFPSVSKIGLPRLKEALAQGKSINEAGVYALLHLMTAVEDTNVLHRAGFQWLKQLQEEARQLLLAPLTQEKLEQLDRCLVQEHISPGGCADLLALSYFLYLMEAQPPTTWEDAAHKTLRRFAPEDIDRVMELWLSANRQAHSFISDAYWEGNFQAVKEQIPQASVQVYEEDGEILGFIGLSEGYIAGLFVEKAARGRGIGGQLLQWAKEQHSALKLQVYVRNDAAVHFYKKHGFFVAEKQTDKQTGQEELVMQWKAPIRVSL